VINPVAGYFLIMKILIRLFKRLLPGIVVANKESRFALGQASLASSRAGSNNFKNLWDAEVKIYSQWGEDGILDYIFRRLEIPKPKVIELGAGNFGECNSRFLAENLNASVVAIDGRKDLIETISKTDLIWKTHILGIQTWVTPSNVNLLIEKAHHFMGGVDLLSLDLDGNDFWIINAADLTGIKVVVVEYNPLFGNLKALTVPEEDTFDRTKKHFSWLYYGANLKAFVNVLGDKGFRFIGTNRVGNNAFFVATDASHLIPFSPDPNDDCYFDWRVRESRDSSSQLSYLSGEERIIEIQNLPLVDLLTKEITNLRETGT
jgi:hypothetical protein